MSPASSVRLAVLLRELAAARPSPRAAADRPRSPFHPPAPSAAAARAPTPAAVTGRRRPIARRRA
jgi:hypothetical protein